MLTEVTRAALVASLLASPGHIRRALKLRGAGVLAQTLKEGNELGAADDPHFIQLNTNREDAIRVIDAVLAFIEAECDAFPSRARASLLAGTFSCPGSFLDAQVIRGEGIVAGLIEESEGMTHPFVESLRANREDSVKLVDAVLSVIEKGPVDAEQVPVV